MFNRQRWLFEYFFMLFDLFIAAVAYLLSFLTRFFVFGKGQEDLAKLDVNLYVLIGCTFVVGQLVSFSIVRLYQPRRLESMVEEWGAIAAGVFLNLLASLTVVFFITTTPISRTSIALYAVFAFVLTVVSHSMIRLFLRNLRKKGRNLRTAIIIGSGSTALRLYQTILKHPFFGLQVLGVVSKDQTNPIAELTYLGSSPTEAIKLLKPTIVLGTIDNPSSGELEELLDVTDQEGSHLYLVPSYTGIFSARSKVETLDGLPVITVREVPARIGLNRVAKRAFDLLFSIFFVIAFSWLYVIIGLLVVLTSKGPVFFVQDRVGLDGKVFKILKFRSMKVQKESASDTIWTKKGDPRVTAIGRFIRKTSLDEIPQFFNVIAGQMSVVGPRPERPFYVEQFKQRYKGFMLRHSVKAGVTGWAQINGFRGDTSIEDRLVADLYYIENWSLALDIKIVLLTPFKGLVSTNAY